MVVNPVKIEQADRGQVAAVCAQLGWAPPLWPPTSPEDPGTRQAREAIARGADVVIACGGAANSAAASNSSQLKVGQGFCATARTVPSPIAMRVPANAFAQCAEYGAVVRRSTATSCPQPEDLGVLGGVGAGE